MEEVGPLYSECDMLQVVPNLLRCGDLPQIATLVAPRPLWLNGAGSRFAFTRNCYEAFGEPQSLRDLEEQNADFARRLADWIARPKPGAAESVHMK